MGKSHSSIDMSSYPYQLSDEGMEKKINTTRIRNLRQHGTEAYGQGVSFAVCFQSQGISCAKHVTAHCTVPTVNLKTKVGMPIQNVFIQMIDHTL